MKYKIFPYEIGAGPVHSVYFYDEQGGYLISPPNHTRDELVNEIELQAPLKAIVVPCMGHTLGIKPWGLRFPNVPFYGAPESQKKVSKKLGVELKPIAELKTPKDLQLLPIVGMKNGEILAVADTAEGPVWFLTDILCSFPHLPKNPIGAFLVKNLVADVGFNINKVCRFMFVKDRGQVKEWFSRRLKEKPPQTLLFSHCAEQSPADLARLRELIANY